MVVHKVLFVCMGNICRSPTAEAVFRQQVKSKGQEQLFKIDSAGTHSYHVGDKADKRSRKAALKRGIDMNQIRARQVTASDFDQFDCLVVMDAANSKNLAGMFPACDQGKVIPMMRFAPDSGYTEVPDPYYGDGDGFELVLDLLEQASAGLYDFLTHQTSSSV